MNVCLAANRMKRVMVVDDEADIRNLVTVNLQKENYVVHSVENGETALAEVSRFKPDLIILDIMMPGLSGLEVCRLLKSRRNTRAVPIILFSALDREVDLKYGRDAGANAYITKPFKTRHLLETVRALLEKSQLKAVKPRPIEASGNTDALMFQHLILEALIENTVNKMAADEYFKLSKEVFNSLDRSMKLTPFGSYVAGDVEKTLAGYCELLQHYGFARNSYYLRKGDGYDFVIDGCIFAASPQHSRTYGLCPQGMFASFLASKAAGKHVKVKPSEYSKDGSHTFLLIG